MADKQELIKVFDVVGNDQRTFALDTLEEYLFFQEQIKKLQTMPLILVDKKNPGRQEITAAGKLIKDYSNALDAKRATLLRILNRVESSAADELLEKLSEFE